jgi:hypothetical protein
MAGFRRATCHSRIPLRRHPSATLEGAADSATVVTLTLALPNPSAARVILLQVSQIFSSSRSFLRGVISLSRYLVCKREIRLRQLRQHRNTDVFLTLTTITGVMVRVLSIHSHQSLGIRSAYPRR